MATIQINILLTKQIKKIFFTLSSIFLIIIFIQTTTHIQQIQSSPINLYPSLPDPCSSSSSLSSTPEPLPLPSSNTNCDDEITTTTTIQSIPKNSNCSGMTREEWEKLLQTIQEENLRKLKKQIEEQRKQREASLIIEDVEKRPIELSLLQRLSLAMDRMLGSFGISG